MFRPQESAPVFEPDLVTLAEALPQFIWVANAAGEATYFNTRCYAFIGMTAAQALGFGWLAAIHPDDQPPTQTAWAAALDRTASYEVEYRIREAATGRYRWFLGRGTPVTNDAGAIDGWIGTCTDIHEQKLLEEAVREHADAFERLADFVPQLIWVTDRDGNLEYLNARWSEFTGFSRDAISNELAWSVVHPDDVERMTSVWASARAGGDAFELEHRMRGADGRYRWFLVRAHPVSDESGSIVRWFGSSTDVDAQRSTMRDLAAAQDQLRSLLSREQRVSEAFQRAALPRDLPHVAGANIDALYRAAASEAEVGGDWYDAFVIDGSLVLCVGDVMGKGLDAAVTMNAVRQCIRGTAQIVLDPHAILDAADRALRLDDPGALVTAFVGVVDPLRSTLRYATAGHPRPLVRRRGGAVDELAGSGLPIGIRDLATDVEASHRIALSDVELLVLYSDGLTEATRDLDAGERRLRAVVADLDLDAVPNRSDHIAERILTTALDDVTILTLAFDR